jgi:alpha-1,3-fucosyltransferase 10
MKHIWVDSYGQCLHNKDLPSHLRDSIAMEEQAFYQILAQYKFILAFQNAVCDDYITEKLCRPQAWGGSCVLQCSQGSAMAAEQQ